MSYRYSHYTDSKSAKTEGIHINRVKIAQKEIIWNKKMTLKIKATVQKVVRLQEPSNESYQSAVFYMDMAD